MDDTTSSDMSHSLRHTHCQ